MENYYLFDTITNGNPIFNIDLLYYVLFSTSQISGQLA